MKEFIFVFSTPIEAENEAEARAILNARIDNDIFSLGVYNWENWYLDEETDYQNEEGN